MIEATAIGNFSHLLCILDAFGSKTSGTAHYFAGHGDKTDEYWQAFNSVMINLEVNQAWHDFIIKAADDFLNQLEALLNALYPFHANKSESDANRANSLTGQQSVPQNIKEPQAAISPAQAFGGIEVKKLGYSLYLKMPDNYMECRASYLPRQQGAMITAEEMANALKLHKVYEGIDQEAVDNFIIKALAGIEQVGVLIASGIPPVDGTDQYFSSSLPPPPDISEEEGGFTKKNMYIVQNLENVSEGETLGRIIPVAPGAPGRSIARQPVLQKPGKEMKYTIGKNIRVEEEEDGSLLLIATEIGRFCHVRGEFSIEETFTIKGNVDFKTGIINFKGVVEVRGDVLDNFDVTAKKGITVTGNIGKCVITSRGDITFNGMDGEGIGKIVCGGTLRARFIHDTTIECGGDIIVETEIHNCNIKTLGKIIVNKDTITGGSCLARGGIEANKLGSPSSQHTNLIAGVDYRYLDELQRSLAELTEIQTAIRDARSLEETIKLRKIAAESGDQIETIRIKALASGNPKINVKSILYENVRVTIGNARQTMQSQIKGPLSIKENSATGKLCFMSLTSLDIQTNDNEEEIIGIQETAPPQNKIA